MASTDFITLAHEDAGRIIWNGCFNPTEKDDKSLQYNVKMAFPKDGPAFKTLAALAAQVKKEAFGDKPTGVESPFQNGDAKCEEDPEKFGHLKGMVLVNFKTKFAPKVYGPDCKEITAFNQKDFYSGCWAVLHLNAFSWTYGNMKKGISFGFDAIQKIRDDERLGGTGGIQTAEQAGFSAAASDRPENYAPDQRENADDWL